MRETGSMPRFKDSRPNRATNEVLIAPAGGRRAKERRRGGLSTGAEEPTYEGGQP